MRDRYIITLLTLILLYIAVITKVILDNIYTSELPLFLIHVGAAASIILILTSLVLSINTKQASETKSESITVEPIENQEPDDEVIELGILEEFKEDYSEDSEEKP